MLADNSIRFQTVKVQKKLDTTSQISQLFATKVQIISASYLHNTKKATSFH